MSDVSILRCLDYTVYTTKLNPKTLGKLDEIATTGIFLGLDKKPRSHIIMDRDSTLHTSYSYLVSSSKTPDIMPDDHVNDRESGYSSPMEDDSTQKPRGPWRGCASGCVGNRPERCSRGRALPAGSTSGGYTDGGGSQLPETQAHGHSDESGHTPCQVQDCIQEKGGYITLMCPHTCSQDDQVR